MNAPAFRRCECCGRPVPVSLVRAEAPVFVCSVCAWRMEVKA